MALLYSDFPSSAAKDLLPQSVRPASWNILLPSWNSVGPAIAILTYHMSRPFPFQTASYGEDLLSTLFPVIPRIFHSIFLRHTSIFCLCSLVKIHVWDPYKRNGWIHMFKQNTYMCVTFWLALIEKKMEEMKINLELINHSWSEKISYRL